MKLWVKCWFKMVGVGRKEEDMEVDDDLLNKLGIFIFLKIVN